MDNDVLMSQTYSDSFEVDLAQEMLSCLQDDRYIKVDGKPLILIYRINIFTKSYRICETFSL